MVRADTHQAGPTARHGLRWPDVTRAATAGSAPRRARRRRSNSVGFIRHHFERMSGGAAMAGVSAYKPRHSRRATAAARDHTGDSR
jgi:hypothetical protein